MSLNIIFREKNSSKPQFHGFFIVEKKAEEKQKAELILKTQGKVKGGDKK